MLHRCDVRVVKAKGRAEIGATRRGKGMKIMAIADRHGLPLSVSTHAATQHEVRVVQTALRLLHDHLRQDGIEMIAPHHANRSKPPTQDRRRLTRYTPHWLVECFSLGCSDSAESWSVGSTIPRISWALLNSPALLSSSGDFETGSKP